MKEIVIDSTKIWSSGGSEEWGWEWRECVLGSNQNHLRKENDVVAECRFYKNGWKMKMSFLTELIQCCTTV